MQRRFGIRKRYGFSLLLLYVVSFRQLNLFKLQNSQKLRFNIELLILFIYYPRPLLFFLICFHFLTPKNLILSRIIAREREVNLRSVSIVLAIKQILWDTLKISDLMSILYYLLIWIIFLIHHVHNKCSRYFSSIQFIYISYIYIHRCILKYNFLKAETMTLFSLNPKSQRHTKA